MRKARRWREGRARRNADCAEDEHPAQHFPRCFGGVAILRNFSGKKVDLTVPDLSSTSCSSHSETWVNFFFQVHPGFSHVDDLRLRPRQTWRAWDNVRRRLPFLADSLKISSPKSKVLTSGMAVERRIGGEWGRGWGASALVMCQLPQSNPHHHVRPSCARARAW